MIKTFKWFLKNDKYYHIEYIEIEILKIMFQKCF